MRAGVMVVGASVLLVVLFWWHVGKRGRLAAVTGTMPVDASDDVPVDVDPPPQPRQPPQPPPLRVGDRLAHLAWSLAWAAIGIVTLQLLLVAAFDTERWWAQLAALVAVVAYLAHHLVLGGGFIWMLVGFVGDDDPELATYVDLVVVRLLLLGAALTQTFAGWTAFWYERGVIGAARVFDADVIVGAATRYFGWNLLDAIPLLEVPQSLSWTLGPTFDDWRAGSLLLVYKLLVIIPIVRTAVVVARGARRRNAEVVA